MKNPLSTRGAVPAFNFYNLESWRAIAAAAAATKRPVIFSASESAIKYMGDDFLRDFAAPRCWLHLDHGRSLEAAKHAIALGFRSVMIDGSALPYAENVGLTRRVVEYAHKHGVPVEAELGALLGFEDGAGSLSGTALVGSLRVKRAIRGLRPRASFIKTCPAEALESSAFTDPAQALQFVRATGCDSLAIAIGTSHGAYKGDGTLDFAALSAIRKLLPKTPLVLHGASTIPQKYVRALGLKGADGIEAKQIRRAVRLGINKVNIDSDARLAWTAAVRSKLSKDPKDFDPRAILSAATEEMIKLYKKEIDMISNL